MSVTQPALSLRFAFPLFALTVKKSRQINEDAGFTDLVSAGCLSVCCGLKTLWQGEKIVPFVCFICGGDPFQFL